MKNGWVLMKMMDLGKAINFINHKFKTSKDESVNNFRVEYAGYEQDIDAWIRTYERHKERPVFVRFQDDQPIMKTGEGSLFVIYEDDGVHYSGAEDEEEAGNEEIEDNYGTSDCPDGLYWSYGLAWWSPIINASFYASIYASFWCAFYALIYAYFCLQDFLSGNLEYYFHFVLFFVSLRHVGFQVLL